MKKMFLGKEVEKEPHKIARDLVRYMLQANRPLSIEQLVQKLSETNTMSNLRTRIKRCLTNTPDIVNEKTSDQSRIFSIPLHYKNIKVTQEDDKFSLNLTSGNLPEIRESDFTNQDLQFYLDNKIGKTVNKTPLNLIIANITWNSKDWKDVSEDMSGHRWVNGENIPHESWNFDFENSRNTNDKIYGFAKFTNSPKVEGNNNLIIFYSQGKIVGFYGKAEILREWVDINERESYNLIANKNLSVVLPNKIENIKDKGYLENLNRVGQVGFSYLKKTETVINILDEAIELNPEEKIILENIKKWVENQKEPMEDEERLIQILKEIGLKDSQDFYGIMEKILSEFSIDKGDKRICYSLPSSKKRIGLTFGQKLCVVIDRTKQKNRFRYLDTTYDEINWLKETKSIQGLFNVMNSIILSGDNELNKTNKTGYGAFSSKALEKSLFENQYKQYVFKKAFNTDIKPKDNIMKAELNQILFGPPGTGKTYNTINKAIEIVDPEFYKLYWNDRTKLKERFKLLLLNSNENGQIAFTTFHQSFSYEDFVEGIKPVLSDSIEESEDTALEYEMQDGIFKLISEKANQSLEASELDSEELISLSDEQFENAQFYKMSLGNSQKEGDQAIFDYCMDNNCITTGFAEGIDFTGKNERELKLFGKSQNLDSFPIQAINLFKNYLKNDNYIVISKGNKYVRAIGKVIGDYEYKEESPLPEFPSLNHFRKVEWIFENIEVPANEVYQKNLSQQTIYKLDKNQIKKEFFVKEKKEDKLKLPKNPKNFVLIIDEINRGNVSSIFGELITLIEKDKRAGGTEELSVILPYSKKEFTVPSNVYIIGTMNTADRSIEALDTALRRRFSFQEMPPKAHLIAEESNLKKSNGFIDDINVVKILDTINDRIEKLIDKDHKIGHSYFMNIKTNDDLIKAFKDKVIPLLEEYFFGDCGKIGLVLGNTFISKAGKEGVDFADFDEYDSSIKNDLMERSVFEIKPENEWDFESIYTKSNNL